MAFRRSPKPGALTATHGQRATKPVHDERGERVLLDVFRNDHQWLMQLDDQFEQRKQVFEIADFPLVQQNHRIIQHGFHLLGIGDEVGRKKPAIELHAFDNFERRFHSLGFLDGGRAFRPDASPWPQPPIRRSPSRCGRKSWQPERVPSCFPRAWRSSG